MLISQEKLFVTDFESYILILPLKINKFQLANGQEIKFWRTLESFMLLPLNMVGL